MTTAPNFKRVPIALSLTPPPRYPPPKSDHLSLLLRQPRGPTTPAPTPPALDIRYLSEDNASWADMPQSASTTQ